MGAGGGGGDPTIGKEGERVTLLHPSSGTNCLFNASHVRFAWKCKKTE